MNRSEINQALKAAEETLARYSWALPDWACWSVDDHRVNASQSKWLRDRQLGWDVTDFGSGAFADRGLTLFCVRNGTRSPGERPYAEKLLFVGVDQETPFHAHKQKLEDIIVRGGGTLCLELIPDGAVLETAGTTVRIDGMSAPMFGHVHRLTAGQSITVPRGVQHRFWGEKAPVFAAEVSQCNDDLTDNYFLEPLGRFSEILEDEPPYRQLWNEVG
ncbi:D-lyxose ketol-isomerase [Labrenzia sp. EL_208]|nr:D-lyxose ketol-isomerase [Labrenzia sp. EL_132]MBG6230975.1 D-lyxose ketol-isomerase [Labrenzia sp. EL_208]